MLFSGHLGPLYPNRLPCSHAVTKSASKAALRSSPTFTYVQPDPTDAQSEQLSHEMSPPQGLTTGGKRGPVTAG